MLEVELTGQRGHAPPADRNGNEAIAVAAFEAFARWLHRQHAPVDLYAVGVGTCRFTA